MNTLDAILTRRSIRSFTPEPIPNEIMQTIIQAAAAAPSGGNAQNWCFISICDPQRIQALRALSPGIIGNPAAVIVLCIDKDRVTDTKEGDLAQMVLIDLGAAMQNILLSAHALGYGGCAIGSYHKQAVARFLKLPENLDIRLLIVLGKPKHIPKCPPKRALKEIYHQEQYRE
ncbi:MAG: nitroreductase family protein [Anaerolineae bacterium]|nr:nitroreductase family protein [Anaerolineae bacterium]